MPQQKKQPSWTIPSRESLVACILGPSYSNVGAVGAALLKAGYAAAKEL